MSRDIIESTITQHNKKYLIDSNVLYLDNLFFLNEASNKKVILYQLIDTATDGLTYNSIFKNADNPFIEKVVVITSNLPDFSYNNHDKVEHLNINSTYGITTDDIFKEFQDDYINIFLFDDVVLDYNLSVNISKLQPSDIGLLSPFMFDNFQIPENAIDYGDFALLDNKTIHSKFSGIIINGMINLDSKYYVSIDGFQNLIIKDLSKFYDPVNISTLVKSYLFRYRYLDVKSTYFTNCSNIDCPLIISIAKDPSDLVYVSLTDTYDNLKCEEIGKEQFSFHNEFKLDIESKIDIEKIRVYFKNKFYNKYKKEYDLLLEKNNKKLYEICALKEKELYEKNEIMKRNLEKSIDDDKIKSTEQCYENIQKIMEIEMEKIEMYKQEQLDIIRNSTSSETDDDSIKKINGEDFSKITEYLDNYIKKRTFEIDNAIEKQKEEREKELHKHFEEKMKQKNEEIELIIDEKKKSAKLNNLQIPLTDEQNTILEDIISSHRAKYEQYFLEEKKKLDELLAVQKTKKFEKIDNEALLYKKKQEVYIENLLLQKQFELEEYRQKRKIEIDNECEEIRNNIIYAEKTKIESELGEIKYGQIIKLHQDREREWAELNDKMTKLYNEGLQQIQKEIHLLKQEKISNVDEEVELLKQKKLNQINQEIETSRTTRIDGVEHEINSIRN